MAEESGKPKQSKASKALESAGKSMREGGQSQMAAAQAQDESRSDEKSPNSTGRTVDVDRYKRGGKIKRSGRAVLHKGEKISRKKKGKRYRGRL